MHWWHIRRDYDQLLNLWQEGDRDQAERLIADLLRWQRSQGHLRRLIHKVLGTTFVTLSAIYQPIA